MSLTLTEARALVAKYIDDADAIVAATADIDQALETAQNQVYLQASTWAPQRFSKEASFTTSSAGTADLSSADPIRILAVNLSSGQSRLPIPPVSLHDGPTDVLGVKTLKVAYIPPLTFPASGGADFVWGQSSLDLPILDDLMCLHAASICTAFLDQPNKQLEFRLKVAEEKAQNVLNHTTWRVMPLRDRTRDSGLGYVLTDPVSLQIVRR